MRNALLMIFKKKDYLVLLIIMLLSGISVSASIPLVTLFLTKELGASQSVSGLFFLTSLVTPFINLYTGPLSDRLASRRPVITTAALLLAIGWALIGVSTHVVMVFVIGVIFLQFLGTLNAQVFALIRDVMDRDQEKREATVSSTIRTGYSFGWTLGPVVGSAIAGMLGYRAAFFLTASLFLLILIPLRWVGTRKSSCEKSTHDKRPLKPWKVHNKPLLIYGGVCVLVLSGETIRLAYLSLLAVNKLELSVTQLGSIMSVAPLTELVAMPLAGMLADRWGLNKLLLGGFLIGLFSYLIFANSFESWHLYLAQILHAILIAIVFGLGVTYAQQLSPASPGLASSIFFSAQSLALFGGSVLGSLGVKWVGLPQIFYLPTMIVGFACLVFVWNDRVRSSRENETLKVDSAI
ncbi:hypothetical protein GCM10011571_07580 [Marinithermofilum abyssi]|uniref:Major facilitator superfamily (MFS) profile domain-containing protein n=1 Tax=Marinithermofilum abyssi TaxID=1571185 RepID=A0A8J2VHL1_9BACL|nr:MFS transporter [Marinithermofilum abyssi]GGE08765.1 hypothetical protein GCM10011571_07580 [Marinithermofilum abyssi]